MSKVSDAISRAMSTIRSAMEGMTTGEKGEFLETLCDDLDDMLDDLFVEDDEEDDVPAGGRKEEGDPSWPGV